MAKATLDQIKAKVEVDMKVIQHCAPSAEREAIEAALDVKYLKARQESLGLWASFFLSIYLEDIDYVI